MLLLNAACHCEERSDAAIRIPPRPSPGTADSHVTSLWTGSSERQMLLPDAFLLPNPPVIAKPVLTLAAAIRIPRAVGDAGPYKADGAYAP